MSDPAALPGPGTPARRRLVDRLRNGWRGHLPTVLAVTALSIAILVLLGPALVGRGAFGGADYLLNFDPWRATAPADPGVTTAPMSDVVDARLPRLDEWGEGTRDGELRLWNPYVAGGTGQHVDAFAPTELPYALLPSANATSWSTLLGVLVAVVGTFGFLRAVGLTRVASIGGAAIYVFTGFQIAWTLWPQSHVGALIPVLFWAVERVVQKADLRSVALLGLATGWMLVEGFPAVTVAAAGAAALYGIIRTFVEVPTRRARIVTLLHAGAGALVGIALAGIALLPLGDLLRRAQIPRDALGGLNSEGVEAIALVSPDALGPPDGPYLGPSNSIEAASFVGMGALILALVAVAVHSPARRGVRAFAVVAGVLVGAFVFLDGPHVDLIEKVPVFDTNPLTRLRSILGFAVAVAAAIGLDALVRRERWDLRRAAAAAGAAVVVALLVVRAFVRYRDASGADLSLVDALTRPLLVGALVVIGIAVAVRWPRAAGWSAAAIVLVLVIDGASFASGWWRTTPDDRYFPTTEAHELLDRELDGDRFAGTGGSLAPGTGTFYDQREPTGNVGHTPEWADLLLAADPDVFVTTTYSRLGSTVEVAESPILDRLAVRYLSYPVGQVAGDITDPPPAVGTVGIMPGSTWELPWPGPGTAAVVLDLAGDLVSADPYAEVTVEVLDGSGAVVGSGQRRVFSGIPAGPLVIPVTTPSVDGVAAEISIAATDDTPLTLGVDAEGTPVVGAVDLPVDARVVLADGITVLERGSSLPRIRWAGRSRTIAADDERVAALAARLPADTVILSEPATRSTGGSAAIDVLVDEAERIVVQVDAESDGHLVVADALTGSWSADIDGERAEIVAADHALAAVAVPAGSHTVVLTADRGAFHIGLAATLAALVVVLGLAVVGVSRQRLARGALLIAGFGTLVAIAVIGWRSLDPRPDQLDVVPLLVLGVVVIISYVVVSIEFNLAGRVVGAEIDPATSLITTIVGTAANLLPVPGSAITRVVVLRRNGAATGTAVKVLALVGGLWLGVSLIAATAGLTGRVWIAVASLASGIVVCGVVSFLLHRMGAGPRLVTGLVATEVAMIGLGALRLWLALQAIGIAGSIPDVITVGVAAPLSAAVGFVPAGLGVREAIAVMLGSLSGLGGAEAAVAASLDRAVGLVTLAPLAGLAALARRRGVGT